MMVGCLMVMLLTGCQAATRQKMLSLVFDGATPTPPPPTRRLRRDLLREIETLQEQLRQAREESALAQQGPARAAEAQTPAAPARPIEQARTWDEAAKLLPSSDDMPDWVKAVSDGVIAPKPGLDPQAAREPVLPLDVELVPADDPTYAVLFRHEPHTAWLSCANCHPAIFQMKRGADTITMDKITEGKYCGVCHGKVAFSADACARCHQAMATP
ncbi:MAG: cytochrome c3 family protein [Candidatus Omnitrophica bacterium]|nr:cytochrome c3 family protein [Candidatus Omnitrophota bacterium]